MGLAAIAIMLWLIVFNSDDIVRGFVNLHPFISNDHLKSKKE
jgi:hypothetical protein